MNLNELIKKYEDKVKECEEALSTAKEKKSTEWEKHYIYISYIYQEVLQDLKQLKEIGVDTDE